MDMTDRADNELVERFFASQSFEIDDAGFSRRVERRLPRRAQRLNRVWTAICGVAGVVLVVLTNAIDGLIDAFDNVIGELEGLVSGFEPSMLTPLMALITVLTMVSVWAYNVAMANK